MEIDRVCKYCHVSAYVAYDNCSPVYKKTFKFEISPSTHNAIIWDKIIRVLKNNGINVELKSWSALQSLYHYIYFFFY